MENNKNDYGDINDLIEGPRIIVDNDSDSISEHSGDVYAADGNSETDYANEEAEIYLPGDPMGDEEVLVYDHKAYNYFYTMEPEWPCLSIDGIPDEKGERKSYPMAATFIAGSQALNSEDNRLYVINVAEITKNAEIDDEDKSDDENSNTKKALPRLKHVSIPHNGSVSRVRTVAGNDGEIFAATYGDSTNVSIYQIDDIVNHVFSGTKKSYNTEVVPVHEFKEHQCEGTALAWNRHTKKLVSGDYSGILYVGFPEKSTQFSVSDKPIEDVAWISSAFESNAGNTVFASAHDDGCVYLWDERAGKHPQQSITVSQTGMDINSIAANENVPFLIGAGDDEGNLTVWDLRNAGRMPISDVRWHTSPISSLQWSVTDPLLLLAAEDGNQITVWDFGVVPENTQDIAYNGKRSSKMKNKTKKSKKSHLRKRSADDKDDMVPTGKEGPDVPEQLLFVHQGQQFTKDARWHPMIPGMVVATSEIDFNIFKPINL